MADSISIKNSDSRLKSNHRKGITGIARELVVILYLKDVSETLPKININ